jgi:dCTP diphosphatase
MTTDDRTTVAKLREAVAGFVDAREWRPFHSPKNLVMSIAIEAAELMERFQWLTEDQAWATAEKECVAEELADVLIYCLSLSNALDLDVSAAVLAKLQVNEGRYPASEFRGRFRRPERDKGSESG